MDTNTAPRPPAKCRIYVLVPRDEEVPELRDALLRAGCSVDQRQPHRLSVEVPPQVTLRGVRLILARGQAEGRWEYDEAPLATG